MYLLYKVQTYLYFTSSNWGSVILETVHLVILPYWKESCNSSSAEGKVFLSCVCLKYSLWYRHLCGHEDATGCSSAIWELQRLKAPALKITLIFCQFYYSQGIHLSWHGSLQPQHSSASGISSLSTRNTKPRPDSGRGDPLQELPSSTAAQDRASVVGEHSWLLNQYSYTPHPFPVYFLLSQPPWHSSTDHHTTLCLT